MKHYTQRCESSQFHGALSTVRARIIGKLRYNGIKDLTLSSVINRSTYAYYIYVYIYIYIYIYYIYIYVYTVYIKFSLENLVN